MPKSNKHKEYDSEPVAYCARCFSLKIRYEPSIDSDCCMKCGCTDILTTNIDVWESLYEKRYGKKFLDKESDIKKSPIFYMSMQKLKVLFFNNPHCEDIIRRMYPRFPRGLSKADSIILFFDKIVKDNKLNEFKILLIKNL
jgi:hypothetical protein